MGSRRIFLSDPGLSRTKPPWEKIPAIDLISGRIMWSKQYIALLLVVTTESAVREMIPWWGLHLMTGSQWSVKSKWPVS